MKNVLQKPLAAIVLIVFADMSAPAFSQDLKACQKIVLQIYEGINQKKANHLLPHLAPDFSMAGQTGSVARQIFPVYITSLNTKVSEVKKLSEANSDGLVLVYEARFGQKGVMKSTFVFDQNNRLAQMDLLPTEVQHQSE